MPALHKNFVEVTVSGTPGTGTVTLGSATSGHQSFATAYGVDATVDLLFKDGAAKEVARDCFYDDSAGTVTRGTFEESTTGVALTLTSAATVSVIATAGRANAGTTVLTYADRSANYGAFVKNDGTNAQTVTDAGWRTLHGGSGGCLLTTEWNVGPIWSADSAGKMTLPEGRWHIGGSGGVDSLTTSQRLFVGVAKNNEATPSRLLARCGAPAASATVCLSGSTIVESNGTDYFELRIYVDGAGTHVTAMTSGFIYFWAEYLGPTL